jgi:hypothetical protein
MLHRSPRLQNLAARTLQNVVSGVIPEAAHRHRTPDRLGLGRDDRLDAALLEPTEDLGVCVARICRDGPHGHPSRRLDGVDLGVESTALIDLPGRDSDVEHDASFVVNCGVLLVGWLEPLVPAARCHGRVGVAEANLLVFAALLAAPLHLVGFCVRLANFGDPAACQRFPTNISADQCRVDVYDLAFGDLRGDAGGDRLLEDPAEARLAPALADACQARVVGQTVGEAKTREPADRQVDVRLAHELAVMNGAEQKAGEHQAHRCFRIDARSAIVGAVKLDDLCAQPAEIKHTVDADEHMIIGN